MPKILITPPAFPALILPPPEFEPVTVVPDSTQNYVGLAAIGFTIMCPVLAVVGAALGVVGIGNVVVNATVIGISLLIGGVIFAVYWIVLEKNRRDEEKELNKLYKQEVRERKRLNDEHFERCKMELENRQAAARKKHEEEVRKYKQEVRERKRLQDEHHVRCMRELNERKLAAKHKYEEQVRIWEAAMGPYRKEAERRREIVRNSKAQLNLAEQAWSSNASNATAHFDRRKRELAALKARHAEIEAQRATEWQQLQARAREIQKRDFLDNCFIDAAPTIGDIGPTRKATLSSFGVETAGDIEINRLVQLPSGSGFGPKRIAALLTWRQAVEAKFVFNPATGVPQQEKQYFESKFHQLLQPIQQQLLNGQQELETIKQSAQADLAKIRTTIEAWLRYCHQMEADARSIPKGL